MRLEPGYPARHASLYHFSFPDDRTERVTLAEDDEVRKLG